MLDDAYVRLVAYLFRHPEAKLHWEWELFNYYMYWSVFTSVLIFAGLSATLLRQNIHPLEVAIITAVVAFFGAYALSHSRLMAQVHAHYRQHAADSESKDTLPNKRVKPTAAPGG